MSISLFASLCHSLQIDTKCTALLEHLIYLFVYLFSQLFNNQPFSSPPSLSLCLVLWIIQHILTPRLRFSHHPSLRFLLRASSFSSSNPITLIKMNQSIKMYARVSEIVPNYRLRKSIKTQTGHYGRSFFQDSP